jgi:hypothetical protein
VDEGRHLSLLITFRGIHQPVLLRSSGTMHHQRTIPRLGTIRLLTSMQRRTRMDSRVWMPHGSCNPPRLHSSTKIPKPYGHQTARWRSSRTAWARNCGLPVCTAALVRIIITVAIVIVTNPFPSFRGCPPRALEGLYNSRP